MKLQKLSKDQIGHFTNEPEAAMDLHVVQLPNDSLGFVIGCCVLLLPDEKSHEKTGQESQESEKKQDAAVGFLRRGWIWNRSDLGVAKAFQDWREKLPSAPSLTNIPRYNIAMTILGPHGPLPAAPIPPPSIYGHLPFTGSTDPGGKFYRCECWPTSRRVDIATGVVKGGTFAFPASELPFVPTGFAAVGRYALPNLLPATRRYELQPPASTLVNCGASVPLHGQAGGGVEVYFPSPFTNLGAIASPILLPVM